MKHKPYKSYFWIEKEAKKLFQELSFYKKFIVKLKIKHLSYIELLLHKLTFFDEFRVVQILKDM